MLGLHQDFIFSCAAAPWNHVFLPIQMRNKSLSKWVGFLPLEGCREPRGSFLCRTEVCVHFHLHNCAVSVDGSLAEGLGSVMMLTFTPCAQWGRFGVSAQEGCRDCFSLFFLVFPLLWDLAVPYHFWEKLVWWLVPAHSGCLLSGKTGTSRCNVTWS